MSVDVGKATGDLTDGLYQIVSAYGDGADTMDSLRLNAMAGAAGLASTTDAINLSSAVTKAWGDTSRDAQQQALDLAFTTVRLGQTTFPELANSLMDVTDVSTRLGVSQEEMFASFATLTGVTGSASKVATQYRSALNALANPTQDAAAMLDSLGYASGQAMVEQLGLQGSMQAVMEYVERTQTPLGKVIGQTEAHAFVTQLASTNAATYAAKLGEMGDASGALEAAFAAQTEGIGATAFKLEQARQRWDVFLQKLGAGLAPMLAVGTQFLEPAGEWLVKMADGFERLNPRWQQWIVGMGAVAAAAGPVMLLLGGLVSGFSTLAPVLAALTGPVGLVAGGLAALIALDIGGFRTKLVNFGVSAWATFNSFRLYLGAVLEDGDVLNDWLTHLPDKMQPAALALGNLAVTFKETVLPEFNQAIASIGQEWAALWRGEQTVGDFAAGALPSHCRHRLGNHSPADDGQLGAGRADLRLQRRAHAVCNIPRSSRRGGKQLRLCRRSSGHVDPHCRHPAHDGLVDGPAEHQGGRQRRAGPHLMDSGAGRRGWGAVDPEAQGRHLEQLAGDGLDAGGGGMGRAQDGIHHFAQRPVGRADRTRMAGLGRGAQPAHFPRLGGNLPAPAWWSGWEIPTGPLSSSSNSRPWRASPRPSRTQRSPPSTR